MKPNEKIVLSCADVELLKNMISYMLDKKANKRDITKLIDLFVELVKDNEPTLQKKGGKK